MHTMQKARDESLWTVGYYEPRSSEGELYYKWKPLKDFSEEFEAARYVNFLNGGPEYPI